jgi:hypothetical protein
MLGKVARRGREKCVILFLWSSEAKIRRYNVAVKHIFVSIRLSQGKVHLPAFVSTIMKLTFP